MSEPLKPSTTSGLHPRLDTEIRVAFRHSLREVPEIYGLRRELALFLGCGVPEEAVRRVYEQVVVQRESSGLGRGRPAPTWADLLAQVRERLALWPTKRRADIDSWLADGGHSTDNDARWNGGARGRSR